MTPTGGDQQMLRVIFVDDESRILDGLRRQFRNKRSEWEMRFANSASEAITMLEDLPAHVIVSDMRMPERNGASLLREVQDRWPATARFILSGQTDHAEMISDIGGIHQFLQKPCDPVLLTRSITRCRELSSVLESQELKDVTAGIQSLPVISETYKALTEAVHQEDTDIGDLAAIVEQDVGLSAKLLQMVNSAFFGLPRQISTVKDAVSLVGTNNIRLLSLTSQIVDSMSEDAGCSATIGDIWKACADTGALCGTLARKNKQPTPVCDAARLAGTLSLIGRAILVRCAPESYARSRELAATGAVSLYEAEIETFKVGQHAVGSYALGLWGFHDDIVEAVARQYDPELSSVQTPAHPLAYVHLARSTVEASDVVDQVTLNTEWVEGAGITVTSVEVRQAA